MKEIVKPCAAEMELRRRIAVNMAAIRKIAAFIGICINNECPEVAIDEIRALISQSKGLESMIQEAMDKDFLLSLRGGRYGSTAETEDQRRAALSKRLDL